MSGGLHFESQRGMLCGLHAVNALLQYEYGDHFKRKDLDAICLMLDPPRCCHFNAHKHWMDGLGLAAGDYDVNVLLYALSSRGLDASWFDARNAASKMNLYGAIGLLVNGPGAGGIRLDSGNHWYALRTVNGTWWDLNSMNRAPRRYMDVGEMLNDVQNVLAAGGAAIIIRPVGAPTAPPPAPAVEEPEAAAGDKTPGGSTKGGAETGKSPSASLTSPTGSEKDKDGKGKGKATAGTGTGSGTPSATGRASSKSGSEETPGQDTRGRSSSKSGRTKDGTRSSGGSDGLPLPGPPPSGGALPPPPSSLPGPPSSGPGRPTAHLPPPPMLGPPAYSPFGSFGGSSRGSSTLVSRFGGMALDQPLPPPPMLPAPPPPVAVLPGPPLHSSGGTVFRMAPLPAPPPVHGAVITSPLHGPASHRAGLPGPPGLPAPPPPVPGPPTLGSVARKKVSR